MAAVCLAAGCLVATQPAAARPHHSDAWARQQFAKAERMREALNGRPAGERTRREYQRVIDAYRAVYFGRPTSSKADPSVVATAELMVEMGRRFNDDKVLRGAVEEYRFLRKEYPGSKYRFDALFTVGEIYKDDLNDTDEARKTFQDFLHRYPRNRLASDARAAVKEIDDAAAEEARSARKGKTTAAKQTGTAADDADNTVDAKRSQLPRVTGVRHWSTPDYTRVAIDIEQEVKFNSQRISRPDRIFFDLLDTKLASTLVGKTFDVDDGFLTKIRVAEFKPGQTRIVLEVDDLSSYDAFLLPDPYRLIIDIHGKQSRAVVLAKERIAEEKKAAGGAAAAEATSGDGGADETKDLVADASAPKKTEKEHAIVAKAEKQGSDQDDEDDDAAPSDGASAGNDDSTPAGDDAKPASGVVKTTVAVKGTGKRIPKTIVSAEDDAAEVKPSKGKKRTKPEDVPDAAIARSVGKGTPVASRGKKSRGAADTADLEAREARPTARGDRSLTRALGLKIGRIVIDAGHGGHDTGTIGPNGLREKDVVLDVAKRLGRLLETRLGAEVIYTRQDDTFIPLETRTAIANREQADLFISIHANSSRDEDARGVETYYLNFTSSPEALEVAARENAVSEKSVHELQDLVKKIALKDKIDESREFASDVQDSLFGGLALSNSGLRNRGVKKAPFIVLIGANMPSILAEISFVSNPTDERKLGTAEHRERIAESLYRGVSKYAGGLSGVKVASRIDKTQGQ
jgi:N-acetylmuramoyl-L-alanine amidase